MKGVILGICPHCQLVDLTHQVDPQNVLGGAFQLERAVPHFPSGTIHLAVVDPGVGGCRRALALAGPQGVFVGPDNGLLTGVAGDYREGVVLAVPANASATFHGRDLFAPAAARLALGQPLASLGQPLVGPLVSLPPANRVEVVWVDHFGNLITNLRRDSLEGLPEAIEVGGQRIALARTYSEVPRGALLALFSSDGCLEIACNGGNASMILGVGVGELVVLAHQTTPTRRKV